MSWDSWHAYRPSDLPEAVAVGIVAFYVRARRTVRALRAWLR
jgi:hypothetical protein